MTYVMGLDPGTSKLGMCVGSALTKLVDLYLCDIRCSVKAKRVVKRIKKTITKKKTKKTQLNAKFVARQVLRFINHIDYILKHTDVVLIEEQKISVQRIKMVAHLLYQGIQARYPNIRVAFIDPQKYRAHFGITVHKKDHPRTSKKNLRLIRKKMSFDNTDCIQDDHIGRVREGLTTEEDGFAVDPIDAMLMVKYYFDKPNCIEEEELEGPVEYFTRVVRGVPLK
jgi:RNase H-fold protein (predicted Holliday junction resolvase)